MYLRPSISKIKLALAAHPRRWASGSHRNGIALGHAGLVRAIWCLTRHLKAEKGGGDRRGSRRHFTLYSGDAQKERRRPSLEYWPSSPRESLARAGLTFYSFCAIPLMSIPSWGKRGCPLLPETLRQAWASESLPKWVTRNLNLPEGADYTSLSADVWSHCNFTELSNQVRKFLINTLTLRRQSVSSTRVFVGLRPQALSPMTLPWSKRTITCLTNSGLLTDLSRLWMVTYGDLLGVEAMGARSVFDFACVAEAAIHVWEKPLSTASERTWDYTGILLEAIAAPWSPQVSYRDARFADILSPGEHTVFERLERVTLEPQDPPLTKVELAREVVDVRTRLSQLSEQTLEVALANLVEQTTHLHGRKLQALIKRFGWAGEPPATLEEAASQIGVTRQRIRQMQKRFADRLPKHPIFMPQLDSAIALLRTAAPVAVDRASQLLRDKAVTANPFHPEGLLAAAKMCRRPQPFEIDYSSRDSRVVLEQRHDLERGVVSIAHKQAGASGATNIHEVLAEISLKRPLELGEEDLRSKLQNYSEFEFLSYDWFWHKDGLPDRNRLRNVTRKMLSVISPIHVNELREGVRRHYRIRGFRGTARWPLITPPRAVLEAFYRAHPEFAVDSASQVSSVVQLDFRTELNSTEQILLNVLRSSPACLLDYESFGKSCADAGMNANTFSQCLSSSPVIAHLGTGLWSLRGIRVDATSVEALRLASAARPRGKRIIGHGWTTSGDFWLASRLTQLQSALVLGVPSAIRRFVVGREFAATDDTGLPAGTVRLNPEGTASYGYGAFLRRYDADEDDVLLVVFKLTEKTAILRLIDGDELEVLKSAGLATNHGL